MYYVFSEVYDGVYVVDEVYFCFKYVEFVEMFWCIVLFGVEYRG